MYNLSWSFRKLLWCMNSSLRPFFVYRVHWGWSISLLRANIYSTGQQRWKLFRFLKIMGLVYFLCHPTSLPKPVSNAMENVEICINICPDSNILVSVIKKIDNECGYPRIYLHPFAFLHAGYEYNIGGAQVNISLVWRFPLTNYKENLITSVSIRPILFVFFSLFSNCYWIRWTWVKIKLELLVEFAQQPAQRKLGRKQSGKFSSDLKVISVTRALNKISHLGGFSYILD